MEVPAAPAANSPSRPGTADSLRKRLAELGWELRRVPDEKHACYFAARRFGPFHGQYAFRTSPAELLKHCTERPVPRPTRPEQPRRREDLHWRKQTAKDRLLAVIDNLDTDRPVGVLAPTGAGESA